MVEITIGQMEAGKKLHRFVRQLLPGIPLSGIYKMMRTGRVKVNGKRAKPDTVLALGDVVRVYMAESEFEQVRKSPKKFEGVPADIDIVYEDSEMLVVNKPAGLLVHGADGEYKDTLTNRVLAYLYRKGALDSRTFTPAPVHRLDRNTSGLVVFAKTGDASRYLAHQFAQHSIRKWYIAIVRGQTPPDGVITAGLGRDRETNRTIISDDGKAAVTRYVRKASSRGTSVVHIELVSGRTHQIRAHFAHIGHPLWGDVKYGGWHRGMARSTVGSSRQGDASPTAMHQWLHAAWLDFPDGRRLFAPLPHAFVQVLRRLGYPDDAIEAVQRR